MKEADWEGCLFNQSSKRVTPDIERAKSLLETANERIREIAKITEKNCNFVFEDYYSSAVELLQALVFHQGYNVLNHICLGYFLRDVLKRNEMYVLFDDLRYRRNSLIYYGKRMDFESAKEAIRKSKRLIEELGNMMSTFD